MTRHLHYVAAALCLVFSLWAAGIHPDPVGDPSYRPANAVRFQP